MTHGEEDHAAFALAAGPTGCLLIHGFSGTPYEMRYLGTRLHAGGYTVRAVRLPGHATHGPELWESGWRQWQETARAGLEELAARCDTVVVAGISMGALLAFQLAHEHPERVSAIVAMAPALLLRDPRLRRYAPLMRAVYPLLPSRLRMIRKRRSDIADDDARQRHPRFPIPVRGLLDLLHHQGAVRAVLPEIRQPVLILHGRHDNTCPIESAVLVQNEIGSSQVRFRILENSGHVITVDADRDEVADEIARFLGQTAAQPRAARS